MQPTSVGASKNLLKKTMDHSPISQTFKFENNWKELHNFSEIVKFGFKILKNVENIVM